MRWLSRFLRSRRGWRQGSAGLVPCAFCRRDELQQPLRVIEQGLQLLRIRSQRAGGELRGQARIAQGRILGDKPHFINPDGSFVSSQNGSEFRGQGAGLGRARREGAHKSPKIVDRNPMRKVDAGEAGGGEQLGKAAVRGALLQRHTIQQNLAAGNSQEQAGFAGVLHGGAQLIPGSLQQDGGALVLRSIQAYSFQEDVETAGETSSCNEIGCVFHVSFANCRSAACRLSPGKAQRFL